jgi:GAF domain-containing protein
VAIAVDRALRAEAIGRLQAQLEAERDHLRLLLEVTNAVVGQLDLHQVIQATATSLQRLVPWDYTTLVLLEPGGKRHSAAEVAPVAQASRLWLLHRRDACATGSRRLPS